MDLMKGLIFAFFFLNKISKGLTMQIYFSTAIFDHIYQLRGQIVLTSTV